MPVEKNTLNLVPRVRIVGTVTLICFALFGFRLWYLQIVHGAYFRDRSENNRLRQVYLPPPRGLIYDRNGIVLARNRPSFQLDLVLEDTPDPAATVEKLAKLTGADPQNLLAQLKGQRRRRPFEPRLLQRDIHRDAVAKIMARRYELPGVSVSVSPAREYVHGDLAAHVLGYIGEIQARQLESPSYAGYRSGDVVGQFGVEAARERELQGQRGIQEVIVNAAGTKIGEASFERERPGHSLTLSIDYDVQRAADTALEDLAGAVVAMDPQTGEILALSSAPRFDPNLFVGEIPRREWLKLVQGKQKPLNNRAIQGVYPPGSVFKIFMSAAALAHGAMKTSESVHCPGFLKVGSRAFKCHKHSGHGSVNHYSAMVMSCDIFFYIAGQRLGVDEIHRYATLFGLGQKTGIELRGENAGLIPSTEWKRNAPWNRTPEQKKWYPGETPSVAIGQGAVTTTPLQITRGVAAVVNGGRLVKPVLIKKIRSHDGSYEWEHPGPEDEEKIEISERILEIVKKDLVGVVNDKQGTGRRAQLPKEWGITVAGKTGTAQVASLEHHGKGKQFEHHAWFVGYAPAEKPEIVVTALVENGGGGGAVAAPVVRQVMEAYFAKKLGVPPPANGATPSAPPSSPPAVTVVGANAAN